MPAVPIADDCLFEFIHAELVNYVASSSKGDHDVSTLEYLGFCCGYRIIERLTKDWPRFKDELDTLKFMCTDFWSSIFKKQIDNLRTNHAGVYVLLDNNFRLISKMSSGNQYLEVAPRYVTFTCGLLRGALANLGIHCVVTSEIKTLPACAFHLEVRRS
ncbi:trafficking protein particle complex subunit 6b [Bemisia tabaci]|uniref:trafficking protein particle complex subunit 6b n=1 Tax=Bemisia tabaci TaxID=7038 RepID=UPI0008F9AE3E|nr:PREDICTED: trafficking protein particle complex subunit 6B [Bemisia tabaci]